MKWYYSSKNIYEVKLSFFEVIIWELQVSFLSRLIDPYLLKKHTILAFFRVHDNGLKKKVLFNCWSLKGWKAEAIKQKLSSEDYYHVYHVYFCLPSGEKISLISSWLSSWHCQLILNTKYCLFGENKCW